MNTVYQVSKSDYQILVSLYRLMKGRRNNLINRQMLLEDSGVLDVTLSSRINNVHIKEKIINEYKEIN